MRHINTKTAREFANSADRYTGAEVRVWVHDLCDNLDALRAEHSEMCARFEMTSDEAAEGSQGAALQAIHLEGRANNEPNASKRRELLHRAYVALALADRLADSAKAVA